MFPPVLCFVFFKCLGSGFGPIGPVRVLRKFFVNFILNILLRIIKILTPHSLCVTLTRIHHPSFFPLFVLDCSLCTLLFGLSYLATIKKSVFAWCHHSYNMSCEENPIEENEIEESSAPSFKKN